MIENTGSKLIVETTKVLYGMIGLLLIALLGGIVSVLEQTVISEKRKFTFKLFFSEIIISAFAGLIMYFICETVGLPLQAEMAAAGIAGNMGSKFVRATHKLVCNYLKCDKDEKL